MTEKRFTKYVPDSYGYTYITTIIDNEKNKQTGNTDEIVDMLNELADENEQLKKELKKYTDAFDCSQCRFQNYDWFDDGDEFEVCEKGNNEAQMENHSCSEWEEI